MSDKTTNALRQAADEALDWAAETIEKAKPQSNFQTIRTKIHTSRKCDIMTHLFASRALSVPGINQVESITVTEFDIENPPLFHMYALANRHIVADITFQQVSLEKDGLPPQILLAEDPEKIIQILEANKIPLSAHKIWTSHKNHTRTVITRESLAFDLPRISKILAQ